MKAQLRLANTGHALLETRFRASSDIMSDNGCIPGLIESCASDNATRAKT